MPDARLPIKVKRIPGGYTVNLSDGRKFYIYGCAPEVACAAKARCLAKPSDLARMSRGR